MGLLSRTQYLASLLDKVNRSLIPLQEQHSKIITLKNNIESSIASRVESINKKLDLARIKNNLELVNSLENYKQDLMDSMTQRLSEGITSVSSSIEESSKSILDEIDGVSGNITVDINSMNINIQPDLFNPVTDFVKSSLTDPDTIINVSTSVSGTAGGDPIVGGVGTQIAKITTS